MRTDEYDTLADTLGRRPAFDLPTDREDFALLAAFLDRNPEFDTSADDETMEKLWALQGTDRDVYVPSDDATLGRLVDLLKRHEDLDLLATLLATDDPEAILAALGHAPAASAPEDGAEQKDSFEAMVAAEDGTEAVLTAEDGIGDAVATGDDEGWFSGEDGDLLDHDDLDRFGERLGYAAGGIVCLVALLASWFQGITVYKAVDSWILSIEVANSEVVLGASAVTALILGGGVGFFYRAFTDDVYEGYRSDLAAAVFDVPLMGSILFVALYLLAPVVLNVVNGLLGDALAYLVGLIIVLVIVGVPIVVGLGIGVGVVVGVPAFAGIFGGSLLGALVRPD